MKLFEAIEVFESLRKTLGHWSALSADQLEAVAAAAGNGRWPTDDAALAAYVGELGRAQARAEAEHAEHSGWPNPEPVVPSVLWPTDVLRGRPAVEHETCTGRTTLQVVKDPIAPARGNDWLVRIIRTEPIEEGDERFAPALAASDAVVVSMRDDHDLPGLVSAA